MTNNDQITLLYIAVVLCVVIGQLHVDKYDYAQSADNSVICQQITYLFASR